MSLDDKYTYPDSGGVLINEYGIRDQLKLDELMNDFVSLALGEMSQEPPPTVLNADYLRSIHYRMFRHTVPKIAGKLRTVDVQAVGAGIPYCRPEYIKDSLCTLFEKLDKDDYLTDLNVSSFASSLAEYWGELSAIHPYRDGNTRSQSFYVEMIALQAGHKIHWLRADVDSLKLRRVQAIVGNCDPLAQYLYELML